MRKTLAKPPNEIKAVELRRNMRLFQDSPEHTEILYLKCSGHTINSRLPVIIHRDAVHASMSLSRRERLEKLNRSGLGRCISDPTTTAPLMKHW
jgi:hypothetical protein